MARPVIPPAPPVPSHDLSPLRLVWTSIRDSLAIWPDYAFDVPFSRNRVLGVDSVLVNDPAGVRHVMATHAGNYVRPVIMPRILRPLMGRGVFLADGDDWRRQRRMLAPSFTPHSVSVLLPHFNAAARDLVADCHGRSAVDLSDAYQRAALNAVLRALFSLPDAHERDAVGDLVRRYIGGPGRPQILDGLVKTETALAFTQRRRRVFQKHWFAVVDAVIAARRAAAPDPTSAPATRDLLDLLLEARDAETGQPLDAANVRDQAATMIFAGYETTARLMFWASYLLTLDPVEQQRVRAEVIAFPSERVRTLDDLNHWPRLRLVLLEALRLYPPVPLLIREPVADDVILGQPVRAGTQVYIAPWLLHRHRAHWQHPTAFMPDRFAGQPTPWTAGGAYLPFGAGPRICIGAVFALAEAQIMLASMLRSFSLSLHDQRPVLPVGRLTIQPSHAAMFRLTT